MKKGLLRLLLLVALVLALVMSLASCDALGLGKDSDSDGSQISNEHTHLFSTWITTKPATCLEEGESARICECGSRESKSIGKTGHNYVNSRCTVCGVPEGSDDDVVSGGIIDIGKMDSFDYSKVPEYSGAKYVTVNGNVPFFTANEIATEAYETYGALDSLGRCTVVRACIGVELMPTEERKDPTFEPTGWVQKQYSFIGSDALYNRCHLIAWQLTAETNNKQNLMTGTRYLNEAMIPSENKVASYIESNPNNHVMYRATPIFLGDNLLASGLLLEAYSVEDEGKGVCFNIFFYNVQPGVIIDYATGDSVAENPEEDVIPECDYVVNKAKNMIHKPTCHNVLSMAVKNRWYYTGDLASLKAQGYTPAGCCLASEKNVASASHTEEHASLAYTILAVPCYDYLYAGCDTLSLSLLENKNEAFAFVDKSRAYDCVMAA